MEILLGTSTRDYGYIITTATINGKVVGLRRTPKHDYKRMELFNQPAFEDFTFSLVNEALENYFKGARYDGY